MGFREEIRTRAYLTANPRTNTIWATLHPGSYTAPCELRSVRCTLWATLLPKSYAAPCELHFILYDLRCTLMSYIWQTLLILLMALRINGTYVCRRREIITVRGQSYVSRPPPPPPTHSPGGEGGGGSIFWKTRDIGLPSFSNNLSTYVGLPDDCEAEQDGGGGDGRALLGRQHHQEEVWGTHRQRGPQGSFPQVRNMD